MKKFFVVLAALVVALAFALPAAAVDIRVNGQWYMAGWYASNPGLMDDGNYRAFYNRMDAISYDTGKTLANTFYKPGTNSVSLYTHKLRMQTTFQIVDGLALRTQFDALENVMGDNTWSGGAAGRASQPTSSRTSLGASGACEQENFEFEAAWVDFKVPFGRFQAGFVPNGIGFGTWFLIDPYTWPTIRFDTKLGPFNVFASIFKIREWNNNDAFGRGGFSKENGTTNDSDSDAYRIGAVYKMKQGEVGAMYEYWRDARASAGRGYGYTVYVPVWNDSSSGQWGYTPAGSRGWTTEVHTINPYVKYKWDNLYVEAEAYYRFGKLRKYEGFDTTVTGYAPQSDVDLNAWGGYLHARYTFKPFYVGGIFVYMSGDDMSDKDEASGSIAQLMGDNYAFNPCLILWNYEYADAMGWGQGYVPAYMGNPRTLASYQNTRYMDNVFFYQIYAGMNITPKLDVTAKLAFAYADEKPRLGVGPLGASLNANNSHKLAPVYSAALGRGGNNIEFVDDDYGTELDILANYKIFQNLTYTVGFGYLWTGDYFKGFDPAAQVDDNYIFMHKLSLMF